MNNRSCSEQVITFIFPMFYFWLIKPLFFNLSCVFNVIKPKDICVCLFCMTQIISL